MHQFNRWRRYKFKSLSWGYRKGKVDFEISTGQVHTLKNKPTESRPGHSRLVPSCRFSRAFRNEVFVLSQPISQISLTHDEMIEVPTCQIHHALIHDAFTISPPGIAHHTQTYFEKHAEWNIDKRSQRHAQHGRVAPDGLRLNEKSFSINT